MAIRGSPISQMPQSVPARAPFHVEGYETEIEHDDEGKVRNALHQRRDTDPGIVGGDTGETRPDNVAAYASVEPVARFVASFDGVPVAQPVSASYADGLVRAPIPVHYAAGYPRGDVLALVRGHSSSFPFHLPGAVRRALGDCQFEFFWVVTDVSDAGMAAAREKITASNQRLGLASRKPISPQATQAQRASLMGARRASRRGR